MKIRTRFAPSPTGYLHVGGLRTALYNYLYAKQNNGEFILRIEDTDQQRLINSATENLIDVLINLNMMYDFGPNKDDQYGPYIQSARLNIYKKHYLQLLKSNKAYVCFVKNNSLFPEEDMDKALIRIKNEQFIVKLKVNKNKIITIKDQIRGDIDFDLSLIEDPIIIKSDGYPTYHFANVIDDHLMQITHVIRGEEWISSLPKHVLLYQAFNWDPPQFYHLPLLLNPDKSKLSKRQGDVSVEDFLNNGYMQEALINFVALLGWHPQNNQELFDLNELIQTFSINRINKSGAIFDKEKLNWMNREYIRKMSFADFEKNVTNILIERNISKNEININAVASYVQTRINRLTEIWEEIQCFFTFNKTEKKELENYNYSDLFSFWIDKLEKIKEINETTINNLIQDSIKKLNISGKNLFIPLRIGLINKIHGPDLSTIITILGVKESIKRLSIHLYEL